MVPKSSSKDFKKYQKTSLNKTYLNYRSHLCLPSGTNLTRNQINKVIKVIINFYENN